MLSLEEIWKKFLEAGLPLNLTYTITNKLSFENLFQVLSLEGTAVRDLDSLVVHVYVYVCACACACACTCACACACACACMCVHVCVHVCTCACVYVIANT